MLAEMANLFARGHLKDVQLLVGSGRDQLFCVGREYDDFVAHDFHHEFAALDFPDAHGILRLDRAGGGVVTAVRRKGGRIGMAVVPAMLPHFTELGGRRRHSGFQSDLHHLLAAAADGHQFAIELHRLPSLTA